MDGMSQSLQWRASIRHQRSWAAFTLVEVMVAVLVLAFGIISSIAVLQRGLQALDTARNLTDATQVMQGEMERLRLKSWAQLQQLQAANDTAVPIDSGRPDGRLSCTREITDRKPEMKEIALTASWRGYDGRLHTARMVTRYCHNGLNDYYYTVH
jgi:type II secretory pathway pseudopilin PulG